LAIRDHAAVLRMSLAMFLVQAGFHGYTASMPLALARAGRSDPEIGFIVGVAALVQIAAALVGGALIDRWGGLRLFALGGLAYLAASLLLLLPGVDPAGSTVPFVVARLLQGVGIGMALPAGLSVIPRLVAPLRQGVALAIAGAAHNLTLVVLPPLSIVVLDLYGLDGVALLVAGLVLGALVMTIVRPVRQLPAVTPEGTVARRRLGFAYRASWAAPLGIMVLFVAHWGVVTAYLPQRAEAAGANIGLFFASDGLFVLLARVPAGWLADRTAALRPVLAGIGLTALGVLLLLPDPTTPLLVVAGALTGVGAALIVTPLLVELARRSSDADRGSAFALFAASFALAIAIGSIGAAPLIERAGFEVTLLVMVGALGLSAIVAVADRGLSVRTLAAAPGEAERRSLPTVGP
jgi:MFS family permease